MIEKKAYAKVNLSLDIVGRRSDGYHLVRMVMQTLDIADILTFEKTDTGIINIYLNNSVDSESGVSGSTNDNLGRVPLGEDNLIYKVAKLILEKYVWLRDRSAGVNISLTKNIPIAAGMAGGSSDAAATFKGMNELFELSLMDKEMMDLGVMLGADIPYCIMGGTALSEGIGEQLTRLPDIPDSYFLVAKPPISVSTAEAYGGYDSIAEDSNILIRPDVDGQVDAIYAGNLQVIASKFANVLECVTAEKHKEIKTLEAVMLEGGALNAMMSGSGPTVFGLFDNREKAENTAIEIKKRGMARQLFVVKPV